MTKRKIAHLTRLAAALALVSMALGGCVYGYVEPAGASYGPAPYYGYGYYGYGSNSSGDFDCHAGTCSNQG